MSAWIYLIVAGALEVAWAVGLKYSVGFTRLSASVLTLGALAGSLWLLALAVRTIPLGTAYAVWVGIGALGTAVLGAVLFGEPVSMVRLLCFALLAVAILGLKLTTRAG